MEGLCGPRFGRWCQRAEGSALSAAQPGATRAGCRRGRHRRAATGWVALPGRYPLPLAVPIQSPHCLAVAAASLTQNVVTFDGEAHRARYTPSRRWNWGVGRTERRQERLLSTHKFVRDLMLGLPITTTTRREARKRSYWHHQQNAIKTHRLGRDQRY